MDQVLQCFGVDAEDRVLEFKKAAFRHQFDRDWSANTLKMENDHFAIMGAIIEFSKAGMDFMKVDPLAVEAEKP